MNLSINAEQALQILQNWEDKYNVYNFDKLQTIQGFQNPKLADCCYLMNINDTIRKEINNQFYEIATTGEGGTYALWNYPELKGEPPVVFFGGDGHYSMIASSLEALTGLFAINLFLFPEVDNSTTSVWQEWRKWHPDLEEIKDNNNLESKERAKEELLKKIKEYKTTVEGSFELKTFENYMLDMNQYKNFRNWYEYVEENNQDTKGEIGGNYYIKPALKSTTNELINLSEFIEIIGLPITNESVIKTTEALGITMPIDVQENEYTINYEEELDFKIIFEKEEPTQALMLKMIGTWKVCECIYPYNIKRKDTYQEVVDKIGKPAKYGWKYSKKTRIWELQNVNNKIFSITIDFKSEELSEINRFIIKSFDPKNIGRSNFEL